MPHSPEIKAVHPLGKIPALRHGDVTLCESARSAPISTACSTGRRSSRPIRWAPHAASNGSRSSAGVDPVFLRQYLASYIFPGTPDGTPNRAGIDAALPKMEPLFAVLDNAVAKTGHLAGDRFTLADAYLTPILYYMGKMPESTALLAKTAHLKSYLDRQLARPSVRDTMPPAMPGHGPVRLAEREGEPGNVGPNAIRE